VRLSAAHDDRFIPSGVSGALHNRPALRLLDRGDRRELGVEGGALGREIHRRLRCLESILGKIALRRPLAAREYKNKIAGLLASLAGGAGDRKIMRDIVMLAERGDIAEELERSRSHFAQFGGLLAGREPVGRTMDFLVQEMMREINTIGSKSNDCIISGLVVKYKSELECIREQVQNIE